MRWYSKITKEPLNLSLVLECLEYYVAQHIEAQKALKPTGRIMTLCSSLPGMVEYRFGQLQELESILAFYERRAMKVKYEKKRGFLEHYNRTLTDRQAEQYAEIDDDVQALYQIIDEVALLRNKFLGLTKGYEYLHFQCSNIIALRKAGIEDATF